MATKPLNKLQGQLLCTTPRCDTILPPDAELCDECGSAVLHSIANAAAIVVGSYLDHPIAFALRPNGPNVVGRAGENGLGPEVDLGRLSGSDSVHHEHAAIELAGQEWRLTHRGRNPLTVRRGNHTNALAPGSESILESGDVVTVGRVRLQFLVVGSEPESVSQ